MYLVLSNRERKIMFFTVLINSVIATVILVPMLHFHQSIQLFISCLVVIFLFQFYVIISPRLMKLFFFGEKDEQQILERKIACLQEEIKRVNGQDYNEDIFHDF